MYDGLLYLLGEEQEYSSCVPTELLVRSLTARVAAELPDVEFRAREVELPDLSDEERNKAIDEIVAGSDYPFIFLDGDLRWTGRMDADAVVASLREAAAR